MNIEDVKRASELGERIRALVLMRQKCAELTASDSGVSDRIGLSIGREGCYYRGFYAPAATVSERRFRDFLKREEDLLRAELEAMGVTQ